MFRRKAGQLGVLLVHPGGPFFRKKESGAWTIPKGEVMEGEDLLDRAKVEFREELGIEPDAAADLIELGTIKQKGGKIVHASEEFAAHAPPAIPVLPEWSPVKVFGGYGAPLNVREAARAGVPVLQHQHDAECRHHGCSHAWHPLFAAADAARNRYARFFGLGCDCFAF